jgi:hypothetical protein
MVAAASIPTRHAPLRFEMLIEVDGKRACALENIK